ncbi:hypothetical protein [Microbacterium jiangjiandongii]|uniref:hypothetical protein n=1 Tax=Microbacterium jiangjiandongii TaxID=3049071 RepID=UPI0027D461A5|nr:hypothetical protein [Microbacterium sp. zg.Y625]
MRGELVRRARESPFLRTVRLDGRVALLPAGSPTAAVGAALVGAASTAEEITVHG